MNALSPKKMNDLNWKLGEIVNTNESKFVFIEFSAPDHITNENFTPKEEAIKAYSSRLEIANRVVLDIVDIILQDKNALIIIGADHGPFLLHGIENNNFKYTEDLELLRDRFS